MLIGVGLCVREAGRERVKEREKGRKTAKNQNFKTTTDMVPIIPIVFVKIPKTKSQSLNNYHVDKA